MSDFLEKDTDPKSGNSPSKNSEPQPAVVADLGTDRTDPNFDRSDKTPPPPRPCA
ncbi:MAG: hypothetical protein HC849_02880 [Oscillatoriales cyanobacterium RU_3_3]|nr:hypothetical protein [Oscillatoriales cyanobacterium RU_3_3]